MNNDTLRELVREAVARHLAGRGATGGADRGAPGPPAASPVAPAPRTAWSGHASHAQYIRLVNIGDACLIEPSVDCTHCGYCKTHGY